MNDSRDFSRASWRLKIERAKQHFEDLDRRLSAYSDSRPYEVRWERDPNAKYRPWRSVFRITRQPDPEIAVILGDVIHNVRSALDHIAVAIAPANRKWNAAFPISDVDLWAVGTDGTYVNDDAKARERFTQALRGMPEEAVTAIKNLQPYATWPQNPHALRFCYFVDGEKYYRLDRPETHYLNMLSRLDNADKHRHLIAIASGIGAGIRTTAHEESGEIAADSFDTFVADGTVVARQRAEDHVPRPKVEVEVHGTVHVAVDMGAVDGRAPLEHLQDAFTIELPEVVFGALEPFVRE